jgi:hypothetical protein
MAGPTSAAGTDPTVAAYGVALVGGLLNWLAWPGPERPAKASLGKSQRPIKACDARRAFIDEDSRDRVKVSAS